MKIDKRTKIGKALLEDIAYNTKYKRDIRIDAAHRLSAKITLDPHRPQRIKNVYCKPCYYSGGIHGRGFTSGECEICKEKFAHNTTYVPMLCVECAMDNEICRRCMSNIKCFEKS